VRVIENKWHEIINVIKGKQSRYRPGVAQRIPGSYGSRIT
jgi:hypothetical protein